jgi:hypothetical protein
MTARWLSDLNDSPLISQRWIQDDQFPVTIIWHQALGEEWPDDLDLIYFVYEHDGNEATVHHSTWTAFQSVFKKEEQ